MTHICKFCGDVWDYDSPCENGSMWGEEGEQPSYCGNQRCPRCSFCQGQKVTEELVYNAQALAAIKLKVFE